MMRSRNIYDKRQSYIRVSEAEDCQRKLYEIENSS